MANEDKIKTSKDRTEAEFQQRFTSLPEDLQQAITSEKVTDAIVGIGKKHGLMIDKIGELGDETGSVMLGITSPGDYIKNLAGKLGVDREKAKAIAEDINLEIFRPIRESLKKVHNIKEAGKKINEPKGEVIRPDIVMPEKIEKPEIPSLFAKKIPIGEVSSGKGSSIAPASLPPKLEVRSKALGAGTQETETLGVESPKTPNVFPQDVEKPPTSPLYQGGDLGGVKSKPAEPPRPLDHEEVRAAVEKSLGGEIRTTAPAPAPQPAKKYIGQDPYQEPV